MTLLEYRNGPLCPQSMSPQSIEHVRDVAVSNRMHEAGKPYQDADTLELPEAAAKIAEAGEGEPFMRLYREDWSGAHGVAMYVIEAFYWRCQVCGFVLPATRMPR